MELIDFLSKDFGWSSWWLKQETQGLWLPPRLWLFQWLVLFSVLSGLSSGGKRMLIFQGTERRLQSTQEGWVTWHELWTVHPDIPNLLLEETTWLLKPSRIRNEKYQWDDTALKKQRENVQTHEQNFILSLHSSDSRASRTETGSCLYLGFVFFEVQIENSLNFWGILLLLPFFFFPPIWML